MEPVFSIIILLCDSSFKGMNSLKNIKIILCGITGGWCNLSNCKMAFTGQRKISIILAGAKPANSHVKCIIINP